MCSGQRVRECEREEEGEREGGWVGGEEHRCVNSVSKASRQHERNNDAAVLLNTQC